MYVCNVINQLISYINLIFRKCKVMRTTDKHTNR